MARTLQVTIDAADPETLSRFWAQALGYRIPPPPGHELGARIEQLVPGAAAASGSIDNLCLTHGRCNRKAGTDTREVADRARQKAEIEMFDRARQKRRA